MWHQPTVVRRAQAVGMGLTTLSSKSSFCSLAVETVVHDAGTCIYAVGGVGWRSLFPHDNANVTMHGPGGGKPCMKSQGVSCADLVAVACHVSIIMDHQRRSGQEHNLSPEQSAFCEPATELFLNRRESRSYSYYDLS
eukprot:6198050-Pleurochrysis_carterae.AAC.3